MAKLQKFPLSITCHAQLDSERERERERERDLQIIILMMNQIQHA